MSAAQEFARMETALRAAVEQGCLAEAEALLVQYADELKRLLEELAGAERERVFRRAMETFQWSRRCTLAARSHAARRLISIQAAAPYMSAPVKHTWDIEG